MAALWAAHRDTGESFGEAFFHLPQKEDRFSIFLSFSGPFNRLAAQRRGEPSRERLSLTRRKKWRHATPNTMLMGSERARHESFGQN